LRLELFRTCPIFSRPAQPRRFHPELSRTRRRRARCAGDLTEITHLAKTRRAHARWHQHGGHLRQTPGRRRRTDLERICFGKCESASFPCVDAANFFEGGQAHRKGSTAARCMAPTHRSVRPTSLARLRLARIFPVSRTGACRYPWPRVGLSVGRRRQGKRNLDTTRCGL
jgi:hypothetical protein